MPNGEHQIISPDRSHIFDGGVNFLMRASPTWKPLLGDALSLCGLTSKISPLGSMVNFDADVKEMTARPQCEDHFCHCWNVRASHRNAPRLDRSPCHSGQTLPLTSDYHSSAHVAPRFAGSEQSGQKGAHWVDSMPTFQQRVHWISSIFTSMKMRYILRGVAHWELFHAEPEQPAIKGWYKNTVWTLKFTQTLTK